MMMRLFSLLMLLTAAAAFTAQPWGASIKSKSTSARFMFSADDRAKELPTVEKLAEESMSMEKESAAPKNVVKDMNTGEIKEVKWVDPAMSANTNPLQMEWWAYILFGFPIVLLLNDFVHFLPRDGPLSFLTQL